MLGRRRPEKARSAKERRQLAREADRIYREKLRGEGVPTTREFADYLAYEVMRSNRGDTAEAIATRACETMLGVTDTMGKLRFTKAGIKKRYQYCYAQMEIARDAEKTVKAAKAAAQEAEKAVA